ncbi:uncharacterized protein LOC108098724 [Drosophila ficusphila]|uniref:uncharacterized protein LOC108098724 n=1 Tax=Drosophila ficusphila TaxID=30025 RepID=UPI0007E82861|nr:uncharacterized protein LOC108098724 [Drosophila ficusphila]
MDNIYHRDTNRTTVTEPDDPMEQFPSSMYKKCMIMLGATVVSWLLLLVYNVHLHKYLPFPKFVLVVIVFLLIVIIHGIPRISYYSPFIWTLAAIVVLCTIVLGCAIIDQLTMVTMVLVMLGVALLILILNFFGAMCPQEVLPGGVCSTLLMMALLAVLFIVGIAHLISGNVELLDAFVSILFVMLIIAIPIQAQFNHGRLDVVELVPTEHLMICSLTVYLQSIMFFCCVCYFILVDERKAATETTEDDDLPETVSFQDT